MPSSGSILALILLLAQVPEIRIAPLPLESAPAAQQVAMGLRIVDVRPDGVYLLGSACPTGGFEAYTALHVVAEAKGQLVAIPNHGYRGGDVFSRVHVAWTDTKRDLARLVPDSGDDHFLSWYVRGPTPLPGAEVRGTLVLPPPIFTAVPSFGTFYGEGDGWLWSSQMSGPGSSGSCLLDAQDQVFAILTATASWGKEGESPGLRPRASMSSRIPD